MIYILLSTFNGERYLPFLLTSLKNQTELNWKLIIRDDGSSDQTLDILKKFQEENENVFLMKQKNIGVKKSFNILIEEALKCKDCEYIMFCDQDDIWEEDKVKKTFLKMQETEELHRDIPVLIHTDLKVVNANLGIISFSMWDYEYINPSFNSLNRLLMHNTITGCTMMLNRSLCEISFPIANESIMHDWWIGLVASAFGKIDFIHEATIKYRQHTENSIGTKNYGLRYIINKIFLKNSLGKNSFQAQAFLNRYRQNLPLESVNMLEELSDIKNRSFLQRIKILWKYKLFKHGFIRNLGLFIKI